MTRLPEHHTLRIDWPLCTGRGLCAEILPERIHLDEWGYPFVTHVTVDEALLALAREAVTACPQRALRLTRRP